MKEILNSLILDCNLIIYGAPNWDVIHLYSELNNIINSLILDIEEIKSAKVTWQDSDN
jgi:hypothetical protein